MRRSITFFVTWILFWAAGPGFSQGPESPAVPAPGNTSPATTAPRETESKLADATDQSAEHDHPIQPAVWNVFLGRWRLHGPFREGDIDDQLAAQTLSHVKLEDPAAPSVKTKLNLGRDVRASGNVIDFLEEFSLRTPELPYRPPHPQVAFATTQFSHEPGGPAVLSLSHDDDLRVWLNGIEHQVPNRRSSAFIDQVMLPVDLKPGTNTLVLRVAWRAGSWEAAARLTPPGSHQQSPQISLWFSNGYPGDTTRLPTLDLQLIDINGKVVRTLRTSGLRDPNAAFTNYRAHLESPLNPDVLPYQLRIRWKGQGIQAKEKTIPWTDATDKKKKLRLLSEQPLRALVVDEESGDPIPQAQFWKGSVRMKNTTQNNGRVSISHLNPLATHVHVAAKGYEAKKVDLPWPFGDEIRVEMQRGGKTLRGKVVDRQGKPIEGAKISPGLYTGYTPKFETDAKGEFVLHSIPSSKNSLSPVIEAKGYVIKDTFSQPLDSSSDTAITWHLQKGANVIGRVTDSATGKGLANIVVTSGESRFASNRKNPSTTTRSDGSFVLMGVEPGEVYVHAFSDHHAPAMETITTSLNHPTPVEFQLNEGNDVTGVVTDQKGNPIPGVWLITDTWNLARMFRREAHTDRNGRFVLPHMPASAAEVHVLLSGYSSKRDLQVRGGQQEIQVTLRRIVRHRISIRTPDGQPVPNLRIDLGHQWNNGGQVSWRSGYERQRFYDPQQGELSISGGAQTTYKRMYRFRAHGFQSEIIEGPESKETPQSMEVVLRPDQMIDGQVTDPITKTGVSDVVVAIVNEENQLRSDRYVNYRTPRQVLDYFTGFQVSTDPDGRFQIPDQKDWTNVSLVLIHPDGGFVFHPDASDFLHDSSFHLSLPKSSGIEGVVLEGDQPVVGRTVKLTWQPPDQADAQWMHFGVGGKLETDAEGRFRFHGLGKGTYRLENIKEFPLGQGLTKFIALDSKDIDVDVDQIVQADFAQPKGATLRGRIVDAQGVSLNGVIIQLHRAQDAKTVINADHVTNGGRFLIDHVPAGDYRFSVLKLLPSDQRFNRVAPTLRVVDPETITIAADHDAEKEFVIKTAVPND